MIRWTKDQQGIHEYERDKLGRVTLDEATSFGTNIDQRIEGIETTYDDFGRVDLVTSYSDVSMSTVANEVQFTYTDLWQVDLLKPEHAGVVDGSSYVLD